MAGTVPSGQGTRSRTPEKGTSVLKRQILISATTHESWVALVENGELAELMFDRPDQGRLVGDIFLGRVEAVLPGIQAAFVDIGTEKAGFLHASDLERTEDDDEDDGGNGRRSRKYPPIQDRVQKGQQILVQATKEPISTKGPRLTAEVSLPGRFLVYMPFSSHVGVSRKIDDRSERGRLRQLARSILPEDSGGIIVRTVGEEVTEATLAKEFQRLHANWKKIQNRSRSMKAPSVVHREAKLISGVIRDLFSDKFDALIIDSRAIFNEVSQYVQSVDPDLMDRVKYYDGSEPLFDKHNIGEEIRGLFERRVELASGGSIVIEPTEALVSIDVNTGRFTGKGKNKDPEKTILKTNLDAAREVARQLRLRDVGGIIVCDFIDMESQQNRDRVLHELRTHLGRDRARTRAFQVSDLGLVEMTRQRVRPSLAHSLTEPCTCCGGRGRVDTPPTVVRRIERALRRASASRNETTLVIRIHPEVALYILEEEADFLRRMGKWTKLSLDIRDDPLMRQDEFRLLSGPAETDVTGRYSSQ
jgi:ribonuclease G